jgi:hypothetical protein
MNLQNIVSGYVAAVNPTITGQYQQSNGYTTGANFKPVPSYAAAISVQIQMQALTYRDLTQISGLNINGEARAMYINGNIEGVDRAAERGGDIITLPDNSVWLVVHVLENWSTTSGWTKFVVTKQNGA